MSALPDAPEPRHTQASAEDAQFYIRDGWTKLAEWTTDEEAAAEPSKPQPMPCRARWSGSKCRRERLNNRVVPFKSSADPPAMPGTLRKSMAFVPRYRKFESKWDFLPFGQAKKSSGR